MLITKKRKLLWKMTQYAKEVFTGLIASGDYTPTDIAVSLDIQQSRVSETLKPNKYKNKRLSIHTFRKAFGCGMLNKERFFLLYRLSKEEELWFDKNIMEERG